MAPTSAPKKKNGATGGGGGGRRKQQPKGTVHANNLDHHNSTKQHRPTDDDAADHNHKTTRRTTNTNTNLKPNAKRRSETVPSTAVRKKGGKLEIFFDPAKRKDYLTGFRARKQERRAFGLAMQKKKDRVEKLDRRRENREIREAEIVEMEDRKRRLLGHATVDDDDDDASDDDDDDDGPHRTTTWTQDTPCGDSVVVTTTFGLPDDSDEEAEEAVLRSRGGHGRKNVDLHQKRSGSVVNFLEEVRRSGVLTNPSKKSSTRDAPNTKRKGRHGAADMKGIGGAGNLKVAKKTLAIVEGNRKGGGGGKKGKGGRDADGKKGRKGGNKKQRR